MSASGSFAALRMTARTLLQDDCMNTALRMTADSAQGDSKIARTGKPQVRIERPARVFWRRVGRG